MDAANALRDGQTSKNHFAARARRGVALAARWQRVPSDEAHLEHAGSAFTREYSGFSAQLRQVEEGELPLPLCSLAHLSDERTERAGDGG